MRDLDLGWPGCGCDSCRLARAAPDMLAALREVEEFLDSQADVDDGRPNDAMRHLVEVRAAIAKASRNETEKT